MLHIEIKPYATLECALTLRADTWAETREAARLLMQHTPRCWRRYSGINRTWYIRPTRTVLYRFLDEAAQRGAHIVIAPELEGKL